MTLALTTHREIPRGDLLHEIISNITPDTVQLVVDTPERTILRASYELTTASGEMISLTIDQLTVKNGEQTLLARAGEITYPR